MYLQLLHQRGGLMDKTLGPNGWRSGVHISGRGKCSLRSCCCCSMTKIKMARKAGKLQKKIPVGCTSEG